MLLGEGRRIDGQMLLRDGEVIDPEDEDNIRAKNQAERMRLSAVSLLRLGAISELDSDSSTRREPSR